MRHPRPLFILYLVLGFAIILTALSFHGLDLDYTDTVGFLELVRPVLMCLVSPYPSLKDGFFSFSSTAGFFYCLLFFIFHFLILRYCRPLNTRSAHRLGWMLAFLVPLQLIDWESNNFAFNLCEALPWALLPFILIALTGFSTFSIPATSWGAIPLLLNYLFLSLFFFTIQGDHSDLDTLIGYFSEFQIYLFKMPYPLVTAFLFLAILPMSAHMFPQHRRLRDLWRPAKLPKLELTVEGGQNSPRSLGIKEG